MNRAPSGRSGSARIRHVIVSVIAALTCLGAGTAAGATQRETLPSLERVYVNPEPWPIADFVLTDHNGQERRFSSLRGQPVLVLFGFTHCPDVCPSTLLRLRALHGAQGGALRAAKIVMISVDGERDTPAALKAFLAPLSADFVGLTGAPSMTTTIAAQFSAVFFQEPAGKDGNYNVAHSGQIFVVDKRGRLRASFVDASIDDMAKVTAFLIQEPY
ncbi:MAG: SCO family protein [Planctomycetota bacterium]|nr:SCO family protein [Planctomycetota bacterium]